jgi:hypothetical protein
MAANINRELTMTTEELVFISAYLDAVDFTETGEIDQPPKGTEFDDDFLRESIIDCLAFFSRIRPYIGDHLLRAAGTDFWYTRQNHGTGFWDGDRGYPEHMKDKFTLWAIAAGSVDVWYEFDYSKLATA